MIWPYGDMSGVKRKAPERQEIDAIIREYRKSGDASLRDLLISQHLYLIQTVARKFSGLGESNEDLLQEGAIGLINAVDLYDPDRGVQFSTYATHLVEGQIRHYLRDKGKLIKQPAWVQELTTKIAKASEALAQKLNRPPSLNEIAERVGTTPENVKRMLEAKERSKVASLDATYADDDDQLPAVNPEKLHIEATEEAHLPIEDRIFLREAMSRLKTLEHKVVYNFYYMDLNQTEIARKLGISVNYASYLLRGAVAKLKKAFEAQQASETSAMLADGVELLPVAYSLSLRPTPTDPITKLATRNHFLNRIAEEVIRAQRYPQQFAIVLVEPDQAELEENDELALAKFLRANVRNVDLVAYIRDDRFGLLLPHTGREAAVLAERVVRSATNRISGTSQSLTLSAGFAVFPSNGQSPEELVQSAEQALAEAKGRGGNCSIRAAFKTSDGAQPQTAAS